MLVLQLSRSQYSKNGKNLCIRVIISKTRILWLFEKEKKDSGVLDFFFLFKSTGQANTIAYTYCAPILTGFGIAGSIANLITLYTSPKFSARIYTYLKYLSLYDLGFLSFAFSLTYYIPREGHAEFYRYLIGTPIVNGFLAASVYVVVCMTIDRYKICFYTY